MAFGQSSDAHYCQALVDKYEQYLDMSSKRGRQPQSLASRVALAKCMSGDASGIPDLEKALQNARFDLPSRTAASEPTNTNFSAQCGPETWSTDTMTYVSLPCPSGTGQ
jgi:hypothetical protein